MKKNVISFFLFTLFVIIIIFTKEASAGALYGLNLWLFSVIPSIYPLLIITELLKNTNSISYIFSYFPKRVFNIIYLIILSSVSGYPLGAKLVADSYNDKSLSKEEACYLLSFVNNPGIAFMISYIFSKTLSSNTFKNKCIFAFYLSVILTGVITYFIFQPNGKVSKSFIQKATTIKSLDDIIYDTSKLIIKIGGYIITFSIFQNLLLSATYTLHTPKIVKLLICTLEISNGIYIVSTMKLSLKYISYLCCTLAIIGGFSILYQIKSVLSSTDLPIYPIFVGKTIQTLIFSILFFCI